MKTLLLIAFTACILLGIAIEAQADANFDVNFLESFDTQGMRHLPSYLRPSSLLRYSRDGGIDDGLNPFGNCTNSATCGSSWVRKVYVGPNCQSSAQTYFERLSNKTDPKCTSLLPDVDATLLTVCDRSLNALGAWVHVGFSDSCPSSGRSQFNGYHLGTCINTDFTDPLASPYSFAVYCSFQDAVNAKPSPSYPAFVAETPVNGTGCANETNSCDAIASRSYWKSSTTCEADATNVEPVLPGILLDSCYNLSDVSLPDARNMKMTCMADWLKVGTYGRGCAPSALTLFTLYSTKQCLTGAVAGPAGSSSRFSCKYVPSPGDAATLYNNSPILMALALLALIML